MDETTRQLRASLPTHLLQTAFLVGKIPFRACQTDTRISYTLYIPQKAYSAVHQAILQGKVQPTYRLPLIVNIHGTRRDASLCRDTLIDYADRHGCAILAPLFPAGLDGPLDLHSYKKLRSKTLKSDQALLGILDEVRQTWPGVDTERFTLLGNSGGGQFVHRFLYIHPQRLARVCVAAPGHTTNIVDKPWPHGTADVETVFDGIELSTGAISQVKDIVIMVGEDDYDLREQSELKQW